MPANTKKFFNFFGCPFEQVHALFQRCNVDTSASCNCGVAVQSGDDVLVIEK